ncbi:MAG: hypothetical protein R6W73_02285 [Candidatus Saliniplasma sp.]
MLSIVPFIIWLLIGIWMYKDAKKRDENAVLWLIVGLVAGIIGLIIWFVVRPDMAEVERKKQGGYQQQQYQQPPQQQQYQQQPPQQQPQQQPQQPPQQQQQAKQCPTCGHQMRHIGQYDKWYCDNCQEYK